MSPHGEMQMQGGDPGPHQPQPVRHRRRRGEGAGVRSCPHCGRMFKRTEHLERHVRTHTKEKPFVCQCGAAFARRDLLTRHQRLSNHEEAASKSPKVPSSHPGEDTAVQSELAAAAATSLSGMSEGHWVHPAPGSTGVYAAGNQRVDGFQDFAAPPYSQQPVLSPTFLGNEPDIGGLDHFKEFVNFLDGVGLPAQWSPFFDGLDRDHHALDPSLRDSRSGAATPMDRPEMRLGTPFSSWLPSAPVGNNIAEDLVEASPREQDRETPSLYVTGDQHTRLCLNLETFRDTVGERFRLPSRHALTRYTTSFFEGFHLHMPFVHHTWRVLDTPLELMLAVSAIGAQYCFEKRNSERLFFASKSILTERLLHGKGKLGFNTETFLGLHNNSNRAVESFSPGSSGTTVSSARNWGIWEPIDAVRTLILLMGYATWEPDKSFVQEAFGLQSLLVKVLRDVGLEEPQASDEAQGSGPLQARWASWICQESTRRAKLTAFTFLHTHSIAYNIYPVLRSNEIHLKLPCSTKEWNASSPSQWQSARRETTSRQLNFQDALSLLLRNLDGSATLDPIPTPFGNYILLHGLLQRIYIVRDLALPVMDHKASLPAEEVDKLERALRSWTSGWQQAPESTLDPNNENGPIPFTSSALLGLAYVRIYLNLGPYRKLETRDPVQIAKALSRSPRVERSDGVISALLYATHALSIPVRLGVDRVARSQAFFWSIRHSLSGLECAVLLSKWLQSLNASVDTTPLNESEGRILHWVGCIVEEACDVVDLGDEEAEFHTDPESLSRAVLQIWAHFFMRNAQWPFINIMGESLRLYRDMA